MNNELNAYIGITIEALKKKGYSSTEIKHIITADLIEYIMETLTVDSEKSHDYYALKPMFVAMKHLIDLEIKDKKPAAYMPEVQEDLAKLTELSNYLTHRIEVLKIP